MKPKLNPILKWAGGKEQELKYIRLAMPYTFYGYLSLLLEEFDLFLADKLRIINVK